MSKACYAIAWMALGLALWVPPNPARAQGDGPRAYQVVPDGTNLLAVYGVFLDGNQTADPGSIIEGGDIGVDLALVQLTHSFAAGGKQAAAFAVLPFGEVSGNLKPPFNAIKGSSSGLGDVILGGIVGLVGPPPLTREQFMTYAPGFALGVLGKVTLPTGSYDADNFLNMGGNRRALQLGVPLGWYIGESFLDPALTTVEFLPSVQFFGDNDDPRGAQETGQDPLFRLEAHVTRNVNRALWVSLDGLYVYGGETSTNGRDNDDTQRAFELGGTLNLNFSPTMSAKLSYGEVVSRNDGGPDGDMVRVLFNLAF